MKKLLFVFTVVTILAGCSKTQSTDPTVSKLEVSMNVESISTDILTYFDIEYSYVDFNGQSVKKAITAPEVIKFSVANPQLGETEAYPFTVKLSLTQKSTSQKSAGIYDSTFSWELDVNGYDQNGKLITDSGKTQSCSSDYLYDNDKFERFIYSVGKSNMRSITYRTFFCKTTSGEWHIGVKGTEN